MPLPGTSLSYIASRRGVSGSTTPEPSALRRPRTSELDYTDILDEAFRRHNEARPNQPFSYGEISETSRAIRERLAGGSQARMFFQTGLGTFDRTKRELESMQGGELLREREAGQRRAAADIARMRGGYEPLSPEYRPLGGAYAPLIESAARQRQRDLAEQETKDRVAKRVRYGVTDPRRWNAEDMQAFDEGKLNSITQIRPVDPELKILEYDGRKFVQAPPGYTELKRQPAAQMDPRERLLLSSRLGELNQIRTERSKLVDTMTALEGELEEASAALAPLQAGLAKQTNPFSKDEAQKEVDKAQAKVTGIKARMRSVATRDRALHARETEMRGIVKEPTGAFEPSYLTPEGGGVRRRAAAPEQLQRFVTQDELDLGSGWDYVMRLNAAGLSLEDIGTLLSQHEELSQDDLDLLEEQARAWGFQ